MGFAKDQTPAEVAAGYRIPEGLGEWGRFREDYYERAFGPASFLPAPEADPAELVETADFKDDATEQMQAALAALDERSQHIIKARWLTEDKMTLHELADVYGISAERIRQIENNAIKKLRNAMTY